MNARLEDLITERWIRNRNAGEITWTTRDGRVIPIKDMTDTHLENTIKMLEREQDLDGICLENICDDDVFFDK